MLSELSISSWLHRYPYTAARVGCEENSRFRKKKSYDMARLLFIYTYFVFSNIEENIHLHAESCSNVDLGNVVPVKSSVPIPNPSLGLTSSDGCLLVIRWLLCAFEHCYCGLKHCRWRGCFFCCSCFAFFSPTNHDCINTSPWVLRLLSTAGFGIFLRKATTATTSF